ncbi:MAG: PKD domain-containing protein, partial [Chitinophagaceae bacterium]|nr:PKD domain-containing protein [Chitinophagaceae bacterium]
GYIIKYSPAGVPIDTIIVNGNPIQTAGGGFAMIGNRVFAVFNTNPSFYSGVIVGGAVTLTPIGQMSASDLATCPQVVQPITNNPVPPPEAAFILSDDTICTGTCITVTDQSTGSPTSWTWSFNGGTPSTSVAPAPGTICFNTAGTYILRLIVSNNGGADTAYQTIVVNQTPTASISGDSVICAGENTVLTGSATPLGNYNYAWSNNMQGATITVAPLTSTTYTLIVSQSGCADTLTKFVQVDALGQAVISGDLELCVGESTTLTVNPAAAGISWSNGSSSASISITPASTTTYSVTGTGTGCTNTATVAVSINPLPSSTFTVTPNPVCVNNPATFVSSLSPCSGNALTFNGSTSSASKGSVVTTAVNNVTIEAWVNWSGTVAHYSIVFLNGNSALDGYALVIPPSSNQLQILIGNIGFLSSSATLT